MKRHLSRRIFDKRKKFTKSALLRRKLKLSTYPESQEKRFIILQIDGLAYPILQKLRKTRHIPFLSELLTRYNVTSYDPGYPTTTPFVQAGIMYGENSIIPGYRFLDKENKFQFNMALTNSARTIEKALSEKNYGILTGGTSIGNVFTGGAKRSLFTAAHFYKTETGTKTVSDILFLILLHPIPTVRVVVSSIQEFLIECYESLEEAIGYFLHRRQFNWPLFFPYFPFFRTGVNAIVREVSTGAALLEMDRNVPYIYINFLGYDWVSHYRGPNSLAAYHLLHDIDRDVKKLYRRAMKKGYDFFVLSDHGQVAAIPFDRLYYETFEAFISRVSKLSAKSYQLHHSDDSNISKYLLYKIKHYYANFSYPLRTVSSGLLRMLRHDVRKVKKDEPIDWKTNQQIMLLYSSSLAHMYLNHSPHRLSLSDIHKKHPSLVEQIVHHPGVGFVIGIEGDTVQVLSATGKVVIRGSKVEYIGEHFLQVYGDEKKLIDQIGYFAHLKYAGDLIINGRYDGKKMVTFETFHFGSHDSIGGNQNAAFFISKEKYALHEILNAKEIYKIFIAYHALVKGNSNKKLYK